LFGKKRKAAATWISKGTWALFTSKNYEEAIECYDKALKVDPKNVSAWNNKGDALLNLKRYEEEF